MNKAHNFCLSLSKTCKTLPSLQQYQSHAITTGLITNPLVAGKLILHSAVNLPNTLLYSLRLLLHTPHPDPFMFNTLIRGFSDSNSPHRSLSLFTLMLNTLDSPPDTFTFAFILKAAANLQCFRTAIQLHTQAFSRGLATDLFVGTTMVNMYGECQCISYAGKLFAEMSERNLVTWNAYLTAFFKCGDIVGAERVFESMGVKDITTYNLMLAGYGKAGEFELARRLFEKMPAKDEVSWSTMIVGVVDSGCFQEAFGCFRELRRHGVRANEVSLTSVLSACGRAGALEFSKVMHCFVEKVGFVWSTPVMNALIDTYAKCGTLDMARLVFERMLGGKCIISWTSIIAGLAMQGHGEEAVVCFRDMEESGIKPDGILFVAILYACSHAGMVEQGCEFFDKMTKVYGIRPQIEHYGCMVDLYGRSGQLPKAYDFITNMPIPPNAVIWRTLLGACSFYGNLELAEKVQEKLSELDPNNCGDHVLLSNIYAGSGKWKDVLMVRNSMAVHNIKKAPGWSMIEVDKVMYTFIAGGKQDDASNVAYKKLKEIMLRIRVEGGYVPEVANVLHDIEEEEKEGAIVTHSEKLAVAFGMERLSKGSAVRIVKNLRVCKDCHTVMKLISKVYGIEIVLRDRNRFHSFTNGICSCKDYW